MTKGKLLLTSSGITNDSIQKALVDLLGKPISEANALFVPTAIYAYITTMNLMKRCQRVLEAPRL